MLSHIQNYNVQVQNEVPNKLDGHSENCLNSGFNIPLRRLYWIDKSKFFEEYQMRLEGQTDTYEYHKLRRECLCVICSELLTIIESKQANAYAKSLHYAEYMESHRVSPKTPSQGCSKYYFKK